jgi:hypothetical protein
MVPQGRAAADRGHTLMSTAPSQPTPPAEKPSPSPPLNERPGPLGGNLEPVTIMGV